MHRQIWPIVLAMVAVMFVSPVALAQSSRIASSSDQPPSADLDIRMMREDGSQSTQFTDELGEARRPSICDDGQRTFYDVGGDQSVGGDLYVKNNSGSGSPQLVLNCPTISGLQCSALDVDCGATVGGNPRIVYTWVEWPLGAFAPDVNIRMATWNVSQGILQNVVLLTDDDGNINRPRVNEDPKWCGNNHVVFARYDHEDTEPEQYDREICTMDVSSGGPGTVNCFDDGDALSERYPSCGLVSGEWRIAFAKDKTAVGPGYGPGHRLCTIDFDLDPASLDCGFDSHPNIDNTRPTWSPSGLVIAYATNQFDPDYDIHAVNASDLNGLPVYLAESADADNDPDWGGALLGQ